MLKYNVKNLMRLRGISEPSAFLKMHGFTQGMATRIAAEKMVGVSPWQVERLCVALKCTPSDLYCWTPEKGEAATESHPLWKLREQEVMSVTEVGKGIPAEKMGEFLEKVKAMEEEMKG